MYIPYTVVALIIIDRTRIAEEHVLDVFDSREGHPRDPVCGYACGGKPCSRLHRPTHRLNLFYMQRSKKIKRRREIEITTSERLKLKFSFLKHPGVKTA